MSRMKVNKKGSYIRDGMAVEVLILSTAAPMEVVAMGISALGDIPTPVGMVPALFTPSGAIINSNPGWTLGWYLKKIKKGEAKLGINYIRIRNSYSS